MQRHELQPKTPRKRKKLIGRGDKTAGRGTKGQKARAGHKIRPEIRDFIKTLPKLRGRGKNSNKSISLKPEAVSLATISAHFKDGDIVSPSSLSKKGLIRKVSGRLPEVKILSTGELKLKVTVINCLVSGKAKMNIESAGGKIK